jgi:hypothetical protein
MEEKLKSLIFSIFIILVFVGEVYAQGWTDAGTSVYLTTSTDKVGIGTTAPVKQLEIIGTGGIGIGTSTPFMTIYQSGNAGIIEVPSTADFILSTNGSISADIGASGNGDLRFRLNGTPVATFYPNDSTDQYLITADDEIGNQFVFTNYSNRYKDHDHPVQTNPTLFVHSDKDPDTDNTEWISLTHDQTNAVINWGSGLLSLLGGDVGIGTTTDTAKLFVEQIAAADAH